MFRPSLLVLGAQFLLLVIANQVTGTDITNEILQRNPKLIAVGNFNGKLYFVENVNVTWSAANNICKSSNLGMVNVESVAELLYLYNVLDFSSYRSYWTAGKRRTGICESPVPVNPIDEFEPCTRIVRTPTAELYTYPCNANPYGIPTVPLCEISV